MTKQTVIAKWKSRGGKYWLELIENHDGSYSYRHDHGGGYMGQISLDQAYERMTQEVESYAFDGHKLTQYVLV